MKSELLNFIKYATTLKRQMPNMRVGPALMGKLNEIDPKLYKLISYSDIDPYYSDNNIDNFINFIYSYLNETPHTIGNSVFE